MAQSWTFLSTHGLVLLAVAAKPGSTQREIGDAVGVTERTAQKVLTELVDEGYLVRTREGRRNDYQINYDAPLRHDLVNREGQIRDLMRLLDVGQA